MKNIIAVLLCIIAFDQLYAIDHYYYFGQKITLNQRDDRVILVTNELGQDKAALENQLRTVIDAGDVLKNSYNNTYEVIFKEGFTSSKVQDYINRFSSKQNLIKFSSPAYFNDNRKIIIICADEFMLKLKRESDRSKLDLLNMQYGVQIVESYPGSRQFNLKTYNNNSRTSLDLSEIYFQSGLFEYAEPNFIYPDLCLLNSDPNDTQYGVQWALKNTGQLITANASSNGIDATTYNGLSGSDMEVNSAWDVTTGNSAIEIGVFDTGIDSTHPDLRTNLLVGYNASTNVNSVATDPNSHGTCTGGLIGAIGNNSLGIAGIAYGCKIRSYQIFSSGGSALNNYIVAAFNKAKNYGAAVLSNSWGGGSPSSAVTNSIDSCFTYGNSGKGCVILFSSGNEGRNPPSYPSYLRNVICVGASTAYDQKKAPGTGNQFWWGGNYGGTSQSDGSSSYYGDIELVAPTICVSTDRQGSAGYNTSAGVAGDYTFDFNGTSCSCPNAAGVAGLIYSVNVSFTAAQVKDFLLRGCDKIDNIAYDSSKTYGQWNPYFGYGRVNAYNSVKLAQGNDVIAPTIVHDNIESNNSTYPRTFTANLTDLGGGTVDATSPKVIYRSNKNKAGWSAFDSASFTSQASNTFTFQIPGYGWETEVQYYLTAKDNSGNRALFPSHAPDSTNLSYYAVGSITSVESKITGPTTIPTAGSVFTGNSSPSYSNFKILKTKVKVSLRHTRVADISVALFSPVTNLALNSKCIFCENPYSGGSTTGISHTTAVDSAAQFWVQGTQPYLNGFFKPDYSFRGLNGLNANSGTGNWKLLIYDGVSGTGGTFDSARITLYKTLGTTSPCAKLNNESDSIAIFQSGVVDTLDFYLKNTGTANLTISGTVFNGTYASKYSLLSSLPGAIAPNDSGLFRVKVNPNIPAPAGGNTPDNVENATMDISTNDPSKPVVKISLQSDLPLPVELASFNAIADRNKVTLNWSTSFEINNSGFDIERKLTAGVSWSRIGNVSGRGSINTPVNYSFNDNNVAAGKYIYRLKQIDFNGSYHYYSLSNEVVVGIPIQFKLSQNYPNPFNPTTKINFDLPVDSKVKIEVFDITGRLLAVLADGIITAGYHTVDFNAASFSSGVYFYRLSTANFTSVKRMVLLK
ncbi:hypothetical protein BH10BAC5_BH10BAC5_09420 [soil metagenome]